MDLEFLEQKLTKLEEPAYRRRQVWEWAARGSADYEDMTNLPLALRATLRCGPVLDA